MHHVDEARLEHDIQARYAFLAEFIGFTAEDAKCIHAAARALAPRVGEMVDRTYEKLLAYDATARHFVPRQHGHDGPVPESARDLTARHPQIQFRKEHLSRYFMSLLGRAYDGKMVQYLDMVGKIHTSRAGNPAIVVPLVQMNALLGLMSDILFDTLTQAMPEPAARLRAWRAFNKLLWIQNDFVNKHYAAEAT